MEVIQGLKTFNQLVIRFENRIDFQDEFRGIHRILDALNNGDEESWRLVGRIRVMGRFFPFYELGFKCNPFRALTDEEWSEVVVVPVSVRQVIDEGFENLQVLGEAGFGKTSLLLYLEAQERFGGRGAVYERIPENGRSFQTRLASLDCFLLDEAQRLEKRERKRLLKQAKGIQLMIGSHENLESLFTDDKRPITTIRLDQTGPDHLRAVINKRLAYFSLDGHEPELFSVEMVDFLWGKFGRNLRAIEQYLYEYFQGLV